jgi:choline-sulfatase
MVGCWGQQQVKTPNIDRLASAGLRFDRAYCNSPVCTASRQSFLTGRYPRSVGVTLLKTALPDSETTLAEMLKEAGYDTAAIGKMHFNSDRKHGFDLRIDQPQYRQWLQKKGAEPLPKDVEVLPSWKPFKDHARVWLNSGVQPFAATDADMAGSFYGREASKYLEQKRDKPFFLMVSFYEPHSPFHFPVEFRGRLKPEAFAVPRVSSEDDWHIPAIFRELTDKEKQGITAAYATSVEFLDRNVGVALDALKKVGREDDTLVIFTGDHGYMLGHHGRFEKHCCFEPAVRAPLLLRYPGQIKAKQQTDALVEFVDIVPTVLDFCERKTPAAVQGRSLKALALGEQRTHRDAVIVEYSENEEAMIRTEQWKLIYGTGRRERQDGYTTGKPLPGRTVLLYDVVKDPDEMTNVAAKPENATIVKDLTSRLAEHLKKTARQPELLPKDGDVHKLLEHCLQPRDVGQ